MDTNRSYRDVLRDRRLAGLLLGDLLANAGTGMIIVAMPVQTLSIHGSVPKAIAIGLVEAAPFLLSTLLALAVGLGRVRVPPRTLLIADCVLRSLTFTVLGVLAVTGRLTLPMLIGGLLFGAMFRMAGSSSRRLLATSMAGETGRFAVNGLLGLNTTFALYIVGPVLGGVIVASASAGVALFFDAGGALVLLVAVLASIPGQATSRRTRAALTRARAASTRARAASTRTQEALTRARATEDRAARQAPPEDRAGKQASPEDRAVTTAHAAGPESGWRILRRRPVAARLLVVEFFFNFFYMPIEVALPLYVQGRLDADASALGLMWGALGVGAFVGAALVNQLRNLPQRHVLIAIIGLWAMCPIALAFVDDLALALVVFGLGGLVWAPFTPVAYSYLQSGLRPDEQQQVVTLWTTGATVAAPLGLAVGGPLIEVAGSMGGLALSGGLTLLLLPIAALAVLRHASPRPSAETA
ncbi:MFS transporter [Phytohabitans sp. ZYX-F-186]|uniref:MFS transporter n=1 Tax=Phytohabitans maris TaxID=3071409 RepID=A0ABU0ZEX8_9ACTN|nr:MFS transporter [Phytohabitans sp. ZYX-F-186]MDQ7905528.1 MFS transporter [Phytohabitans sp. ZYX-F-186]